jgi:hypothetical protein
MNTKLIVLMTFILGFVICNAKPYADTMSDDLISETNESEDNAGIFFSKFLAISGSFKHRCVNIKDVKQSYLNAKRRFMIPSNDLWTKQEQLPVKNRNKWNMPVERRAFHVLRVGRK